MSAILSERRRARKKLINRMEDMSDDKKIYATNEQDIRIWFDIINQAVFLGKLRTNFTRISIVRQRKNWAHYTGDCSNVSESLQEKLDGIGIVSDLSISKNFPNIRGFINVLAHEMVHHYQFECEKPGFDPTNISHGKSFWKWKDPFRKYGLNLQRVPKI